MRTGDRGLIRDLNAAIVLGTVRDEQPVSRVAIAARTGLSPATVTTITARMLAEGWILEAGSQSVARGRSRTLLRLDALARLCVGVKVAPDVATAAVAGLEGAVLDVQAVPLGEDPKEALDALVACVRGALKRVGAPRTKLAGIGLAVSGLADPCTGISISTPFHRWSHLPIRTYLSERFHVPVHVDNDANAFTLAEHMFGNGRAQQSLVGVTLGVGIGAGLLLHGQLYRGAANGAGEIGHMTVEPGGPQCSCGKRGCLEAVAGDAGIVRDAHALMARGGAGAIAELAGGTDGVRRSHVVAAARRGDAGARAVLRRAAERTGLALSWVVQMVNPDAVVIGGELTDEAGPLVLEPIEATLRDAVQPALAEHLKVLPAVLGDRAWTLGGVALVLRDVFRMPVVVPPEVARERRGAAE